MQIILIEDVDGLGFVGDTVKVKPGYARNYLLPKGLALEANTRNASQLKHRKQMVASRVAKKRTEAEALAGRLRGMAIEIAVLVGEGGRLFGSVTNRDIEQALVARGFVIDRKKISLEGPIRELGEHTAKVRIHPDVEAPVTVSVVAKNAPAVEEADVDDAPSADDVDTATAFEGDEG